MSIRSDAAALAAATKRSAGACLFACVALSACSDATGPEPETVADLVKVSGDEQEAVVGTVLPQLLAVRVVNDEGRPVAGAEVRWATDANEASISTPSATDEGGVARAEWILGTSAEEASATASIGDHSVTFTATGTAGAPALLLKAGGDDQAAEAGTRLADSLAVTVEDEHGNPVRGASITWRVTEGGGAVSPDSSVSREDGTARTGWTLGAAAGLNVVTVSVGGAPDGASDIAFVATAHAGAPDDVIRLSGDLQEASAGESLPDSLVVGVHDAHGNPVAGVDVTWTVTDGGGSASPSTATTDSDGRARTAWTLGSQGGSNTLAAQVADLPSVTFSALARVSPRIVIFGDSNFSGGWSGATPDPVALSYLGSRAEGLHRGPEEPHHPTQLAAKIEAEWAARHGPDIQAINHAIGGTGSGFGRHSTTAPHARHAVDGIERFRAEVLGIGYPWDGGESGDHFPDGPVQRVQAFTPTAIDFVVIGFGTNDPNQGLTPAQTRDNIRWMVDQWKNAGLPARNLIITTLPPARSSASATSTVPEMNDLLRALAASEGTGLVDLAAHVSDDNGRTWKSPDLHVWGDEIHYAEQVRDWLAGQVVSVMEAALPPGSFGNPVATADVRDPPGP